MQAAISLEIVKWSDAYQVQEQWIEITEIEGIPKSLAFGRLIDLCGLCSK